MFEQKESFIVNKSPEEILGLLRDELVSNSGRVIYFSPDTLRVKLGSMILTRLLGLFWLARSLRLKKLIPVDMSISVFRRFDGTLLEITCIDNIGKFYYRDNLSREIYSMYFQEIIGRIKEACSIPR